MYSDVYNIKIADHDLCYGKGPVYNIKADSYFVRAPHEESSSLVTEEKERH
jgi:hypothetical protein